NAPAPPAAQTPIESKGKPHDHDMAHPRRATATIDHASRTGAVLARPGARSGGQPQYGEEALGGPRPGPRGRAQRAAAEEGPRAARLEGRHLSSAHRGALEALSRDHGATGL